MTAEQIKINIKEVLQSFAKGNLTEKSIEFFEELGYVTERRAPLHRPSYKEFKDTYITDKKFDESKAKTIEWKYIDLLFQLSKDEVLKQSSLFDTKQVDRTVIETYLFFAIELSDEQYSRTELSLITREVNRLFPMPAMILFRYGKMLTLSVINRRLHKRDESKDVLEKVTLIKDIVIENPHRAHIEILFDLSFDELKSKHQVTNFVELHNAWQKTLDTKELNKRFYSELFNWYLWAVRSVKFPNDVDDIKDDMVYNSENIIRLLTRLIFVWFIKEKNLVPDSLFELKKLKEILKDFKPQSEETSVYYRAILQNLFFATLNTPMDRDITIENKDEKRRFINTLPKTGNDQYLDQTKYRYQNYFKNPEKALELFSIVPFLNGGLFECLDFKEGIKEIRLDGFSSTEKRQAFLPDKLFFADEFILDLNSEYGTKGKKYKVEGLINILDGYKFTITENTPLEEEIALDPELLGKVFENLLASYNPETQTTARKQTGSFYTPREVVNYMVDESLIAYFKQKLDNTDETENKIRDLFVKNEDLPEFSNAIINTLIQAISESKILDPACGSGAFPMGVLHRLVDLLNKLDPENKKWNELQKQRAIAETADVFESGDVSEREIRLNEINKAFDLSMNYPDYARKLFLIENCIYGVDIQQIAIQISKLRFFISLIVDQKVNDSKPNRNILSMPNLETKFVAANTLISVDKPQQMTLIAGDVERLEKELASIRHKIFFTRRYSAKKILKKNEKAKREELQFALTQSGFSKNVAGQMAGWNPFDPIQSAKFFDPGTMYGFKDGFNIIIGNPPFVEISGISVEQRDIYKKHFQTATGRFDLYLLFIEKAMQLKKSTGGFIFILPGKFLNNKQFAATRKLILYSHNLNVVKIDDKVFEASVDNAIIQNYFTQNPIDAKYKAFKISGQKASFISETTVQQILNSPESIFRIEFNSKTDNLILKIQENTKCFEEIGEVKDGIVAGAIKDILFLSTKKDSDSKKLFFGKNLSRYNLNDTDTWVNYKPAEMMKSEIIRQGDKRTGLWMRDEKIFKRHKIIYRKVAKEIIATYDEVGVYYEQTIHSATVMNKNVDAKFVLGLFNSILFKFYYHKTNSQGGDIFPQIRISSVEKLPIKIPEKSTQVIIQKAVDFVLFLSRNQKETSFFERLIDAMVYELYLPEAIQTAKCEVFKHLSNFPQLEDGELEKNLKTVEMVYKELSNSKHPVSKAIENMEGIEEIRLIESEK